MKILVHDFAGHPFQAELSRELASRGHEVTHAWFAGDTGPKGRLRKLDQDPDTLQFQPIGAGIDYSKTNFLKRRRGDIAYGRQAAQLIRTIKPNVVISGNTPTEAQEPIVAVSRRLRMPFIYWCQDFYSIAASRLLEKKIPIIGNIIGGYYRRLERRQMQASTRILHITEAFCEQTDKWGIQREKVDIFPNWGALDEISLGRRDNEWSKAKGLDRGTRFLYSGTLAMKHNPVLLTELANSLEGQDEVILVSAGIGADFLSDKVEKGEITGLRILPLQPFEVFSDVLASGDVLLAVIEREAGAFSVPSKILSYLCAGRPIVLAAPSDNLAAQMLREIGAGIVVEPDDIDGFVNAAHAFRSDQVKAENAGCAGRSYAEGNFELSKVADRFEKLLHSAIDET